MNEMISFFDSAANSVSNLCLGADLMVGFPSEPESDFEETCENFLNLPFAYCHTFTFSEREGTSSYKDEGSGGSGGKAKEGRSFAQVVSLEENEFSRSSAWQGVSSAIGEP